MSLPSVSFMRTLCPFPDVETWQLQVSERCGRCFFPICLWWDGLCVQLPSTARGLRAPKRNALREVSAH